MTGRLAVWFVAFLAILAAVLLAPLPLAAGDVADAVAGLSRRDLSFPKVGKYEVLCGDFHIHTTHSDGKLSTRDRMIEAWQFGYDAVAITDHGNFKAYEEAVPYAKSLGLVLLRGIETGIDGKEHVVALGISGDYVPRNPHRWAEKEGEANVFYREQLRRIAEAGGMAVYAHPHVGLREPMRWAIDSGLVQGIEVKNDVVGSGWGTVKSHGTWCYPFAFDWALEHDLTLFANSDIHGHRGEKPQSVTLVLVSERSPKGVLDALRAGRTIAWFDGMLWGRQEWLEPLLKSLIEVSPKTDAEGGRRLQVVNRGPVALEAVVRREGEPETSARIEPRETLLFPRPAEKRPTTVRWTNLWVSPKENLQTTH
jgi:3',5'-nucleoside bisphosphate phosphatase